MMSFSYGDFLNVPREAAAFNREKAEKGFPQLHAAVFGVRSPKGR
jgi:hypothetical protein